MAAYFFDTSAFAKYYHAEAGTSTVQKIFGEPERRIQISNLGLLEAQSAFAAKIRSATIDNAAAGVVRARMMLDIAAGEIEVLQITQEHFRGAALLLARYGPTRPLRTLDALQLALVLDLRGQRLLDTFIVADHALYEIVRRENVPVLNPADPE